MIIGTSPNGRFISRTSGQDTYKSFDGTTAAFATTHTINSLVKLASSYGASGQSIVRDGLSVGTSTYDGSWGNDGALKIPIYTNTLTGYVQKLKYYPARVTDTQLQLLTQ